MTETKDEHHKVINLQVPVLSAVDVKTGMSMSSVVKSKGSIEYAFNELRRFVEELGRSHGIVQSDQEASIRQLCRDAAAQI